MDDSDSEFTKESLKDYRKKMKVSKNGSDCEPSSKKRNASLNFLQFRSDDEVKDFISKFEIKSKKNYVIVYRAPKTSLGNHNRKKANINVKFRHIRYDCIHGPKTNPTGNGNRST